MPAYHPGQGLNKEALERLRARWHAEGVPHLPATDESQQRERLLGGDAKKKTRCGICTRPLSEEEEAAQQLLCARCTKEQEATAPSEPRLKTLGGKAGCYTPSTDAASEDSEPLANEPGPPQPAPAGAPTAKGPAPPAPPPPSREQLEMAAARKRLEGEWTGVDGSSSYQVHFHREFSGTCVDSASSRTFTLTCDLESQVIWWGLRKAYCLKVSDLCSNAERVFWRPYAASGDGGKPRFVWHRPHPTPEQAPPPPAAAAPAKSGDQHDAPWPSQEAAKAQAIEEIEEQLAQPGSDGRVRVPRWNQRYRQALGTMRQFLESCSDRFTVIPGDGKEYTVALVRAARARAYGPPPHRLPPPPPPPPRALEVAPPAPPSAVAAPAAPAAAAAAPRAPEAADAPEAPVAARPRLQAWRRERPEVAGPQATGAVRWEPKPKPAPSPAPPAEPERVPLPAKEPTAAKVAGPTATGAMRWEPKPKPAPSPAPPAEPERVPVPAKEPTAAKVPAHRAGGTMRWEPKLAPSPAPPAKQEQADVPAKELATAKAKATEEQDLSAAKAADPAKAPTSAKARPGSEELAAEAIRRLEEQLWAPKSGGFVWVQNWNQRYLRSLGTLRSFMEARPEKFKVIPLRGKGYRVELVQ